MLVMRSDKFWPLPPNSTASDNLSAWLLYFGAWEFEKLDHISVPLEDMSDHSEVGMDGSGFLDGGWRIWFLMWVGC